MIRHKERVRYKMFVKDTTVTRFLRLFLIIVSIYLYWTSYVVRKCNSSGTVDKIASDVRLENKKGGHTIFSLSF